MRLDCYDYLHNDFNKVNFITAMRYDIEELRKELDKLEKEIE